MSSVPSRKKSPPCLSCKTSSAPMSVKSLPNSYAMTLLFLRLWPNDGSLRCFSNLHEGRDFLSDLFSVRISRPYPAQRICAGELTVPAGT